jgi:DNA-binding GntR family transcriptional regulator
MAAIGARRGTGPESRVDDVFRALHRAIAEQALLPGTKLPEDLIGQQFGVSRTIVRAAITRLQARGLVEVQHNRGAAVAIPSLEQARQVFAARRCLEREIVRTLAGRLDAAAVGRLESHVQRETDAQGDAVDPHEAIRLAGDFHVLLADMAGNEVMRGFVAELVSRSSLILAVHARPHSAECAATEHRQVIEALRDNDADGAAIAMDNHLSAVEGRAYRAAANGPRDISEILRRYMEAQASGNEGEKIRETGGRPGARSG